MSRRARAVAFGLAALVCAALAAQLAGGYRSDAAAQLGPLRPVVVAARPLPAGRPIAAETAAEALEVRRIPSRFAPADALTTPAEAVGRAPAVPILAGSYLLASQLEVPKDVRPRRRPSSLGSGRQPVEIAVAAAGALRATGPGARRRVDVVVTTEPGPGGGPGRTYVAAKRVRLLDLRPSRDGDATGSFPGAAAADSVATLALTRSQALRLIQAESFARQVRLIGR